MARQHSILYRSARSWFRLRRTKPFLAAALAIIPFVWPIWFARQQARDDELVEHLTRLCKRFHQNLTKIRKLPKNDPTLKQLQHELVDLRFSIRYILQQNGPMVHAYMYAQQANGAEQQTAADLFNLVSGPLFRYLYEGDNIEKFKRLYADKLVLVPAAMQSSTPSVDHDQLAYGKFKQAMLKQAGRDKASVIEEPNLNTVLSVEQLLHYLTHDIEIALNKKVEALPSLSNIDDLSYVLDSLLQEPSELLQQKTKKLMSVMIKYHLQGTPVEQMKAAIKRLEEMDLPVKSMVKFRVYEVVKNNLQRIYAKQNIFMRFAIRRVGAIISKLMKEYDDKIIDSQEISYNSEASKPFLLLRQHYPFTAFVVKRFGIANHFVSLFYTVTTRAREFQSHRRAAEKVRDDFYAKFQKPIIDKSIGHLSSIGAGNLAPKTDVTPKTLQKISKGYYGKRHVVQTRQFEMQEEVKENALNEIKYIELKHHESKISRRGQALVRKQRTQVAREAKRIGVGKLSHVAEYYSEKEIISKSGELSEFMQQLIINSRKLFPGKTVRIERQAFRKMLERQRAIRLSNYSAEMGQNITPAYLASLGIAAVEIGYDICYRYCKELKQYYGSKNASVLDVATELQTEEFKEFIEEKSIQLLKRVLQRKKIQLSSDKETKIAAWALEARPFKGEAKNARDEEFVTAALIKAANQGKQYFDALYDLMNEYFGQQNKMEEAKPVMLGFASENIKPRWGGFTNLLCRINYNPEMLNSFEKLRKLNQNERRWVFFVCSLSYQNRDGGKLLNVVLQFIEFFQDNSLPLPETLPHMLNRVRVGYNRGGRAIIPLTNLMRMLFDIKTRHGQRALHLQMQYLAGMPEGVLSSMNAIAHGAKFVHNAMLLDDNVALAKEIFPEYKMVTQLRGEAVHASWMNDAQVFFNKLEEYDASKIDHYLENISLNDLENFNVKLVSVQHEVKEDNDRNTMLKQIKGIKALLDFGETEKRNMRKQALAELQRQYAEKYGALEQREADKKKSVRYFICMQALLLRYVAKNYQAQDVEEVLGFWQQETGVDLNSIFLQSLRNAGSDKALSFNYNFNQQIWNKVLNKIATYPRLGILKNKGQRIHSDLVAGPQVVNGQLMISQANTENVEVILEGDYAQSDIDELIGKIHAPDNRKQVWRRQLVKLNRLNAAIDESPLTTSVEDLSYLIHGLKILHSKLARLEEDDGHTNKEVKDDENKKITAYVLTKLSDTTYFDKVATIKQLLTALKALSGNAGAQAAIKKNVDFLGWSKTAAAPGFGVSKHIIKEHLNVTGLAIVREMSSEFAANRNKKIWLRPEQAVVVLQALSGTKSSFQVKTGEGKTLTSTLVAILSAIQGNQVRITTSNDILAEEGARDAVQLASKCGLRAGHLRRATGKLIDLDIVFSRFDNAAMSRRMRLFHHTFSPFESANDSCQNRPLHLIADEDDETHVNEVANTSLIGAENVPMDDKAKTEQIDFLEQVLRFYQQPGTHGTSQLHKYLNESKDPYYCKSLATDKRTEVLNYWQKAYEAAQSLTIDVDYIISDPIDGRRYIRLVNPETGVVQPKNCYLQEGAHHILVMRERLRLKLEAQGSTQAMLPQVKIDEGNPTRSQAHDAKPGPKIIQRTFDQTQRDTLEFPDNNRTLFVASAASYTHQAQFLTGLSGTTGSGARQSNKLQILREQLFGAGFGSHFDIPIAKRKATDAFFQWTQVATKPGDRNEAPGHQTLYSRRFVNKPVFVSNETEYFEKLLQTIRHVRQQDKADKPLELQPDSKASSDMGMPLLKKPPPTLVIFKTIDEINRFYKFCTDRGFYDLVVYDGVFPPEGNHEAASVRLPRNMVMEQSKQGKVTLATFLAGRGVDFKLRYAFIPHGLEDSMHQSAARVARNMDKGTVQPLINLEELARDMGKIGLEYDPHLGPQYNFERYQVTLQEQDINRIRSKYSYDRVIEHVQEVFFLQIKANILECQQEDRQARSDALKRAWVSFFGSVTKIDANTFEDADSIAVLIAGRAKKFFSGFSGLQAKALKQLKCAMELQQLQRKMSLASTQYYEKYIDKTTEAGLSQYRQLRDYVEKFSRLKVSEGDFDFAKISEKFISGVPAFVQAHRFKPCLQVAHLFAAKHAQMHRLRMQVLKDRHKRLSTEIARIDAAMQHAGAGSKNKKSDENHSEVCSQSLALLKQFEFEMQQALKQVKMVDLVGALELKQAPSILMLQLERDLKRRSRALLSDEALTNWLQEKTGWGKQQALKFVKYPPGERYQIRQGVPLHVYSKVITSLKATRATLVHADKQDYIKKISTEKSIVPNVVKRCQAMLPKAEQIHQRYLKAELRRVDKFINAVSQGKLPFVGADPAELTKMLHSYRQQVMVQYQQVDLAVLMFELANKESAPGWYRIKAAVDKVCVQADSRLGRWFQQRVGLFDDDFNRWLNEAQPVESSTVSSPYNKQQMLWRCVANQFHSKDQQLSLSTAPKNPPKSS